MIYFLLELLYYHQAIQSLVLGLPSGAYVPVDGEAVPSFFKCLLHVLLGDVDLGLGRELAWKMLDKWYCDFLVNTY